MIDVGHFLTMAFADWFNRKEMKPSALAQQLMVDLDVDRGLEPATKTTALAA